MEKPYIPIILGTARKERSSSSVAEYITTLLSGNDAVEVELIDVEKYLFGKTIPSWEESPEAERWREKASRAAGYIIVSPEYNHSFPGELKILLDAAYEHYEKKPVLLAGVSGGGFGGVRVVEALIPVVLELGMVPTSNALYFPRVKEAFTSDGQPTDSKTEDRVTESFTDFLWFVNALLRARNNN